MDQYLTGVTIVYRSRVGSNGAIFEAIFRLYIYQPKFSPRFLPQFAKYGKVCYNGDNAKSEEFSPLLAGTISSSTNVRGEGDESPPRSRSCGRGVEGVGAEEQDVYERCVDTKAASDRDRCCQASVRGVEAPPSPELSETRLTVSWYPPPDHTQGEEQ